MAPLLRVHHGQPDPAEPGWWHCAELLADPDALPRWRAMIAGWLRDHYGEAPARTVDGYLINWYLAAPARLAALLFHVERRVPALSPADLSIGLAEHRPRPDRVALLAEEFACLPTDPVAGAGPATVVADDAALAGMLRARFIGHAAAFVAAFAPLTRFGHRTLWAAATDALTEALWLTGQYRGNEAAGVADARLVLPEMSSPSLAPLTSGSTLRTISSGSDSGRDAKCDAEMPTSWTRRRESCCFHYALRAGLGPCDTCPRLCSRGQV